ncbi:hypothetical protein [Kitasatospora kazusensis]|uniref:DUF7848 domain-containing protein n=1 Tax=Kitasatospora kazusensis TaxID=407974 RepID=UPI0031D876A7
MAIRKRYRFLNWTIRHDNAPDAPPTRHMFRCLGEEEDGRSCGAEGPVAADFQEAQRWPFEHLREHQDHRSFAHVAEVPWLMIPEKEPS